MRRSRLRKSTQLTVGLAALGLLAAACSSSSSTASTPAGTASSPASATAAASSPGGTGAAAGGPIVVGGLQDGDFAGIDTGFNARIARFNAAGGVDGRKVQLLGVLNDGDNPATDLSDAQTLVLKDHVFAVTPIASQVLGTDSATLFAQNTTPYIGWGGDPSFCGNNWGFPLIGCEVSPQYQSSADYGQAAAALGKPLKGLKVAVMGTDNAAAKQGAEVVAATATKVGADIVYNQSTIPQNGASDYTPYVQAIMATNPDVVLLVTSFTPSVSLSVALRQAGYKGGLWNPTAYVPGLLTSQPQLAAALNGTLVVSEFPPAEDNTAVTHQIESDLKASGASTNYSLGTAIGWWSAEEFIQELQATAAKGPITQANFEKVINAGWTIKPVAGGLTGVTFPADHTKPDGCSGTLQVVGTKYVSRAKYFCNPAAIISLG